MLSSAANLPDVELHHMRVQADGSITVRADEQEIRFTFQHLGFAFTGTLLTGGVDAQLELQGTAGLMPFSIQNPTARAEIGEIIRHSKDICGVKMSYRMDNRIQIIGHGPVVRPITTTHLLAAAIEIIISLEPYLKLFAKHLAPAPNPQH
jgi:hypothetical protein